MRLKHSKYRNTGILFELLVRQITADTLKGTESPAIELIKKYFVNTQLGKEYRLYESILKAETLTESKANALVSTILESSSKLNRKTVKREKYNLIKELKSNYDLASFFSTKLPSYKRLASVYTLVEAYNSAEDIDTNQIVDNKVTILELLTKADVKANEVESEVIKEFKKQDPELRALAYRILLEKFNDKYEDLTQDQKNVLKEYIESENSSTKMRSFYNDKIVDLQSKLTEQIENVDSPVIKIKLKEVLKYLVEVEKGKNVNNDDIVDLLEYYGLVNEVKKSNG